MAYVSMKHLKEGAKNSEEFKLLDFQKSVKAFNLIIIA